MPTTIADKKFIFLVNPISGTKPKTDLGDKILKGAAMAGAHAIILPTVEGGDYQFVRQKIEEENYTDVVICGGDGTVNQVVDNLRNMNVRFGIIPLGSGNGLAYSAGIPKPTNKAIELAFSGKARFIDAFMVNDQFACMLCGLGFDAKVAHDFAQQPSRGLLTYTQQTLKNFFTANSYHFDLVVNDHVIQTDAFFISIANSNQFGNQFTIAPKASLNDGLLDIVVVPKMNKAILPFALIQQVSAGQFTGVKEETEGTIQYFQTPKLQLRNRDGAPLHIDGEPKETCEYLNIKVLPRCFSLIQPVIG
ncbi:diacylglycerol kinase family protein [Flavihumibacter sp. ZG627]|uniref:diacylglycerol/lipid kinase family protein n=1 Tax=Flavihumibacter sp. ZG627 TaxID=1463156 RepID=UPI00057CB1DA|nr:YegS/Rv2252/BmrU family lipid kinase [Flavihumibacter sp. ZG627]KIC91157.1 diacylglycerol kinase [Flavihumibacter sp. ZG627]